MSAADEIYRRYAHRTYSIALRMLGCPTSAETVTEKVLLRVLRRPDEFRGTTAIYRWTVNTVLAHRRKEATVGPICQLRQTAVPSDDNEREPLEVAIGNLPVKYRDALILADVERLPKVLIGELLGLSRGEVKSRLHHARLRLCVALR